MVASINIISAYNLTLDKNVLTKNIAKHLKILIKVMNEHQDPNQYRKNTDRIRILILNIECALSSGYLPWVK